MLACSLGQTTQGSDVSRFFIANSLQKLFLSFKSFECAKSIRNYEKKIMHETSDAWSMSHSSQQPSNQVYYIGLSDFTTISMALS